MTCPTCALSGSLGPAGPRQTACSACHDRFASPAGVVDLVRGSLGTALDAASYDDFYAKFDADRFAYARRIIAAVPDLAQRRWDRVLEVGAGTGQFTTAFFAAVDARAAVITDVSPEMLEICRRRMGETDHGLADLLFVTNTGEDLYARPGSFDLVVGNGVLHHVPDYSEMLRSAARALMPGGVAVLVEPALAFHRALVEALVPVLDRLAREPGAWEGETDQAAVANFVAHLRLRDRYRADLEVLAHLEDKHLFDRREVTRMALSCGFAAAEVMPYGDPNPRAALTEYLEHLTVHPATAERLATELPDRFDRLDPRDAMPGYILVLRRGDGPPPPVPADPQAVGAPRPGAEVGGLHYDLAISVDGSVVDGWIIADRPVDYLRLVLPGGDYRYPVGAARLDVHAAFRDAGYDTGNLLFCGVLGDHGVARGRPRSGGATLSAEFPHGVRVELAAGLDPGPSRLSSLG